MPAKAPDVLGHGDVCRVLGVSRQGLDHIRKAQQATFPVAAKTSSGPVWARKAIEEWKREHR
jgi:predicted DNA-binding transcriptional regulator AlpA